MSHVTINTYVEVDVDLGDIDTHDLITELRSREKILEKKLEASIEDVIPRLMQLLKEERYEDLKFEMEYLTTPKYKLPLTLEIPATNGIVKQ